MSQGGGNNHKRDLGLWRRELLAARDALATARAAGHRGLRLALAEGRVDLAQRRVSALTDLLCRAPYSRMREAPL